MTDHFNLSPYPVEGRVYATSMTVLLSDTDPSGRMRLDAISRSLHDIATLDVEDTRVRPRMIWILRSVVLSIASYPRYLDILDVETSCSGYGKAWAERRTRLKLGGESIVEAGAIWVNVSSAGGGPKSLGQTFFDVYGTSAAGRHVSARSLLRVPTGEPFITRIYPLRVTDLDIMGHVNNAIHTSFIEQLLADAGIDLSKTPILTARTEFGDALEYGQPVTARLWKEEGTVFASLSQTERQRSFFEAVLET